MYEFKLDGDPQGNFKKMQTVVKKTARCACWDIADMILAYALQEVPVDTGNLKSSGTVEYGDGWARVGFGGALAPYAVIVHDGSPAHTETVREHYRMAATGAQLVHQHDRDVPTRPPRPWLTNAIRKVEHQMSDQILQNRLKIEMKREGIGT